MQHRPAPPGRRRSPSGPHRRGFGLRARRRPESGAALIEAALVLPVLVVFLLGIIEFGLVYATGATATGSTRSGARLAATVYAPAKTTTTTRRTAADQIADAVTADMKALNNAVPIGMVVYRVDGSSADGAPTGGFPGNNAGLTGGCSSNCFRYTWNAGQQEFVYSSGDWASPAACGVNVDSVGVYVVVQHNHLTQLIGDSRYVNGRTVMRLEPLPTDQCS